MNSITVKIFIRRSKFTTPYITQHCQLDRYPLNFRSMSLQNFLPLRIGFYRMLWLGSTITHDLEAAVFRFFFFFFFRSISS